MNGPSNSACEPSVIGYRWRAADQHRRWRAIVRIGPLAILFMWSSLASAGPIIADAVNPTAPCLSYDDSSITLSGTVFSRIYFGPPGYGENPASDAREGALLLLLDAPICVKESSHPELDNNAFEGNVILIQLAAVHVDPSSLKRAEGKRATVRGSLYHRLTGHHRTPVLMDVYDVRVR